MEEELTDVAGDTKAGTLIATDRYGNKYYENLEDELPCVIARNQYMDNRKLTRLQYGQDGWTTRRRNSTRKYASPTRHVGVEILTPDTDHRSSLDGMPGFPTWLISHPPKILSFKLEYESGSCQSTGPTSQLAVLLSRHILRESTKAAVIFFVDPNFCLQYQAKDHCVESRGRPKIIEYAQRLYIVLECERSYYCIWHQKKWVDYEATIPIFE